jgi:DnaK suppressor protein
MEAEKHRLELERELTLQEIKRLRGELETEVERRVDGGEDSVDAAADVYEREKTLAIIRTLENKLESIDRAIDVASKGTYGICEICGKAIDPARLEIVPQTTTCVQCQEKLERAALRRSRTTFRVEEE